LETPGELKLLMESLVKEVVIEKNKKAAVVLTPPLALLGLLTPSLTLRGEKPKMEFIICLEYSLMVYYGGAAEKTRVFTQYSEREYSI
jgi:hypothetical protein